MAEEGYVRIEDFATKVGWTYKRTFRVYDEGRLIGKKDKDNLLWILDAPLKDHPVNDKDIRPRCSASRMPPKPNRAKKLIINHKKLLKEKYLPIFLEKSDPGQMVFSVKQLTELLGIAINTLSRDWKRWGLVRSDVPSEYRHLSDNLMTGEFIYYRRDIYRFLNGEWDEKEKGTQDDIVIGAAAGAKTLSGTFFEWDTTKVYPLTGVGFMAWLKDKEVLIENKRLRKWTRFIPRGEQKEFYMETLKVDKLGDFIHKIAIMSTPRGEGKSKSKGTLILMYTGLFKKVEDIVVGDKVMGPDSKPREVLSLGNGKEEMFKVTPMKGESFVCNKSHILSMEIRKVKKERINGKHRRWSEVTRENIRLVDYMAKTDCQKELAYLYRVPINWPKQKITIDPYFLGHWLSDGTTKGCVDTTVNERDDHELLDYLRNFAVKNDIDLKEVPKKGQSAGTTFKFRGEGGKVLRKKMQVYNLFDNKHIPHAYKATSRGVRLQILAGIMDSDGYVNNTGYIVAQKRKVICEDIAFIARSLGFHATVSSFTAQIRSTGFKGTYYKVYISGNCSIIPVKIARKRVPKRRKNKNVLRSRIKSIESQGIGEYYGITLTDDGLYLLEDFTVTHNTLCVSILTLFFFFNGYMETVILAGNSKDQSKFTHYDLCKSIIQRTPALNSTPGLEIKEKNIMLKTAAKEVFSSMQAVPTSVGLLPNTTRAIFTELHNSKDPKFFYDLWTSLRNVPNAMVLVDTTVARTGHVVHDLWESYTKGDDPCIYFFHYADKHYNPEMTERDLNHFKQNMPESLFNMYFRNRWGDAEGSLFSIQKIREIGMYGIDSLIAPCIEMSEATRQLIGLEHKRNNFEKGEVDLSDVNKCINDIERRYNTIDELYSVPATSEDLRKIGERYGVKFIIGVGLDRAQSLSKNPGRTVMTCVARGVVNSETSFYFILDMFMAKEYTLDTLAHKFMEWSLEYGWIDKVIVETYAGEDFYHWCMDKAAEAEFVSPTFARQRPIFMHLYQIVETGYLKCPAIPHYSDEVDGQLYNGFTNKEDVFREELQAFTFIPGQTEKTGWFGSTEKKKKGGKQDDSIYSLAWAISATHGEGLAPSSIRGSGCKFPSPIINKDVVGDYR